MTPTSGPALNRQEPSRLRLAEKKPSRPHQNTLPTKKLLPNKSALKSSPVNANPANPMDILKAIKEVDPTSSSPRRLHLQNKINQLLLQQQEEDLFCLIAACCCALITKRSSFVSAMDYMEHRDAETRNELVHQSEIIKKAIDRFLYDTREVSSNPTAALPKEAAECIMVNPAK